MRWLRILLIVVAVACFGIALSYPIRYRMAQESNNSDMEKLSSLRAKGLETSAEATAAPEATDAKPEQTAAAPTEPKTAQTGNGEATASPGRTQEGEAPPATVSETAQTGKDEETAPETVQSGESEVTASPVERQEGEAPPATVSETAQTGKDETTGPPAEVKESEPPPATVSETAQTGKDETTGPPAEVKESEPPAATAPETAQPGGPEATEPPVETQEGEAPPATAPETTQTGVSEATAPPTEAQADAIDLEPTAASAVEEIVPEAPLSESTPEAEPTPDPGLTPEPEPEPTPVPEPTPTPGVMDLILGFPGIPEPEAKATRGPTPTPEVTVEPSPTPNRRIYTGAPPYPLKEKVTLDPDAMLPELKEIYELNHDLVGWINIPDTVIDYPVVQTQDSDFYLSHDFYGEENVNGQIILDTLCDPYTPSYNLVISGHHMKNGSMFGDLPKYASKSYWAKHPFLEFDTLMARKKYVIFAAFYSADYDEDEEGFRYNADIQYDLDLDLWLAEVRRYQCYDTEIDVEFGDELITLTTCNRERRRDGRFVVVCRKIREGEKFE